MIDLPVVRLYETAADAQRAVEALQRWGFESWRIVRIAPPDRAATFAPADSPATAQQAPDQRARDQHFAAATRAASIPDSIAALFAEEVRRGRTLLMVHAPFGTGGLAEDMMAAGSPVAHSIEPHRHALLPSHLAAPLSRALGLPTLTRRGRTTSEVLGLPTLTRRGRTTSEALGIPAVTRSDHFTFGTPHISANAAPFSRALHLPVLTRRGRTLGEALGLPELLRTGRFVFGTPHLSRSPAPFSAMLGLPVLIRDRPEQLQPRRSRAQDIVGRDATPATSEGTNRALPPRAADPRTRTGVDRTERIG